MNTSAVRISEEIVKDAVKYAPVTMRSVPKQIEHWIRIGKIAEENPDLPYEFIRGVLEGRSEMNHGDISTFTFRKK